MHYGFMITLIGAILTSSAALAADSTNDSFPPPDPGAKASHKFPHVQFDVDPLTPKGGLLSSLEVSDPGLASDLWLYSVNTFKDNSPDTTGKPGVTTTNPDATNKPAATPSTVVTLTVDPTGTITTTTASKAGSLAAKPSSAGENCTVNGLRTDIRGPKTVAEAINDIDSNQLDKCYHEHVIELAKAFISRSDALCSLYVSNIDGTQRSYKTAFSVLSTIFGGVGALVPPAGIFSALSGMSSGISGNLDAGVFYGEAGYLLATSIQSAQAENRTALYARMGISTSSVSGGAGAAPASTSTSNSANTPTVITITLKPGTPATPATAAKAAIPAKLATKTTPAKPAIPAVAAKAAMPATPPATEIAFGGASPNAVSSSKASAPSSVGASAADLKLASIGAIYSAVNDYHVGCTVRVGLNQLQNKLNSPVPVKATGSGTGVASPSPTQ